MIEQIDEISADQFSDRLLNEYFMGNKPLIVRGLFLEPDGYKRWSEEFLLSTVNGVERTVEMSVYEKRDNKHEQFFETRTAITEPVQNALKLACSDPQISGRFYNLLEASIPELVNEVELPEFLSDKTKKEFGYLWIGNGNITSVHFDAPNNFYFQLKGAKIFHLFDP